MRRQARAFFVGCMVIAASLAACGSTNANTTSPAGTPAAQTPTATSTVGLHPMADWTAASAIDAFAKDVQFAASAANTGYACGMTAPNTTVQFAATQDGGVTWQAAPLQAFSGVNCNLLINPTVPTDLVMTLTICSPPQLDCNYGFPAYRSRDGGHQWTLVNEPASNGPIEGSMVWAGEDLYILTGAKSPTTHRLAVSKAGGPTQWVDLHALYTQVGDGDVASAQMFAIGTTLALSILAPNCAQQCPVARTADGGTTWTVSKATGATPRYFTANTDGKTLVGLSQDGQSYLSSSDGGLTWSALPALPAPDIAYNLLDLGPSAPDGTIYTVQVVGQPEAAGPGTRRILRLAPGATNWATIDTKETLYTPLSVSCDAQGHPLALWGGKPWTRAVNSQPGSAYRTP